MIVPRSIVITALAATSWLLVAVLWQALVALL